MVGGGPGAFIGKIHRIAAQMEGNIQLVAGCFSSDPERSRAGGRNWLIDPSRTYGSYQEMAAAEASLPNGERIDFVTVVTPNHLHYPIIETFLQAGFNVVSDKPATFHLQEAKKIAALVQATGKVYALTHNYSGYPMVKEARHLVRSGALGRLLKVVAEYPQDWLLNLFSKEKPGIAKWRTDPQKAGPSNCIGDIGTHAEHLVRYITGLEIDELCADFTTYIPGSPLEDDANILVHYKNPYQDDLPAPRGIIYASQISSGEENGPHLRIYGTKAGLEWHQPEPNQLLFKPLAGPMEIRKPGHSYNAEANRWIRLPPGHPEAFLEAFANIYREAAKAIDDEVHGRPIGEYDFPGVRDALLGMAFIEGAVASSRSSAKWTKFPVI